MTGTRKWVEPKAATKKKQKKYNELTLLKFLLEIFFHMVFNYSLMTFRFNKTISTIGITIKPNANKNNNDYLNLNFKKYKL